MDQKKTTAMKKCLRKMIKTSEKIHKDIVTTLGHTRYSTIPISQVIVPFSECATP